MCDIIIMSNEISFGFLLMQFKSGRLSGLPLFFLHGLWYNIYRQFA